MISLHQNARRATGRGKAVRAVAVLAVAIGAGSTAVAAAASTGGQDAVVSVAPSAAPSSAAAPAPVKHAKPGFFEKYRGHHIMGWGSGEMACAYIDGVRLVLLPGPDGTYGSAVRAYQAEDSVRAITKASVKALGEQKLATPADPAPHCPTFAVPTMSGT